MRFPIVFRDDGGRVNDGGNQSFSKKNIKYTHIFYFYKYTKIQFSFKYLLFAFVGGGERERVGGRRGQCYFYFIFTLFFFLHFMNF